MTGQTRQRRVIAKPKRNRRNAREEDDDEIVLPDCAFNPGILGR
jgi:hypothetical protein